MRGQISERDVHQAQQRATIALEFEDAAQDTRSRAQRAGISLSERIAGGVSGRNMLHEDLPSPASRSLEVNKRFAR